MGHLAQVAMIVAGIYRKRGRTNISILNPRKLIQEMKMKAVCATGTFGDDTDGGGKTVFDFTLNSIEGRLRLSPFRAKWCCS